MNKALEYTLFIDILGFSQYVKKHVSSQHEATEIFEYFDGLGKRIKDYNHDKKMDKSAKYEVNFTLLSDALVFTAKPIMIPTANYNPNFHSVSGFILILNAIDEIVTASLDKFSLPIRGAISIKKTFWKDGNIVGPGLIEAYELESKEAIYPRVILSDELIENKEVLEILNSIYLTDTPLKAIEYDVSDKIYFINIYARAINQAVGTPNLSLQADEELYEIVREYNLKGSRKELIKLAEDSLRDKALSLLNKYKESIIKNLTDLAIQIEEKNANKLNVLSLCKLYEKYNWLKDFHNRSINTSNKSKYVDLISMNIKIKDKNIMKICKKIKDVK